LEQKEAQVQESKRLEVMYKHQTELIKKKYRSLQTQHKSLLAQKEQLEVIVAQAEEQRESILTFTLKSELAKKKCMETVRVQSALLEEQDNKMFNQDTKEEMFLHQQQFIMNNLKMLHNSITSMYEIAKQTAQHKKETDLLASRIKGLKNEIEEQKDLIIHLQNERDTFRDEVKTLFDI
jgi:hypothetical protein